MTLLPYAVLLYTPFVCASLRNLNATSIPILDVSDCPSCGNTRTLWNIIWSCVATLLACTWTAVHPNIPGMDERKVAITSRRLFIMVVALISPELMITWAVTQLFWAWRAARDFNDAFGTPRAQAPSDHQDISEGTATSLSKASESSGSPRAPKPAEFRGWTVTHGFFAWMGGFMLYVNNKPRATLTPDELLCFVREGSVDMPVIMEAEIEDRSKGDALSKGIAIFQLVWFILQLVARYVQNLPITLLEIDTLAVAALSWISYCLWWKKPKDVGRPYIVHWKATSPPPSNLTYDEVHPAFSNGGCSRYFCYLVYPLTSLMGISRVISPRTAHSRRVPSLGGYGTHHDAPIALLAPAIGTYSGIVFGGIHCLGWNFFFQSHAEQILWRAASLGMACICASQFVFVMLGAGYWNRGAINVQMRGLRIKIPSLVLDITACYCVILSLFSSLIYITSRVTLVVLMILSFRSLPPGVYDTVVWTEFVPHL
ncbi:hypothetical protein DFH29DRAFT_62933 [Suillus ampliporus]|nr:hypothetical protein DFH29DRAFT_62933 [Suillus ampliporus]